MNGTTVLSAVTYEPFGGVNGWTLGNGTSTVSRTFNGDGLISQIVTAGVTLGYSFDNANRITGITDSSNSALTWTYGYDPLDRLTSASTAADYGRMDLRRQRQPADADGDNADYVYCQYDQQSAEPHERRT